MRKLFIFFIMFICASSILAADRNTEYRNFWQPTYRGKPLNYCNMKGQCGLPVAKEYCKQMGYASADHQNIANNVGVTHIISSNARCRGWQCNGFKTIRCTNPVSHTPPQTYHYRYKRYVFPRFNHYRVDWCYDGSNGCGKKAAFSFCRRLGFMNVKTYKIQTQVPATAAIGNQKLCFGSGCKAFEEISCMR